MLEYEFDWGTYDVPYIVTIEYEYDPGEPMIHTYPNGDPGHPGSAPSVTIYHAWATLKDRKGNEVEVDVLTILENQEGLDGLEGLILEDNHE